MNKTEKKIAKKFDDLSNENIVSEDVKESDFELIAVKNIISNFSEGSILDVGCGKGKFSKKFKELGFEVTGIEISEKLLNQAKNNVDGVNFKKASATEIPYEDDFFDFVICIEVLEHIPDHKKAIREMIRVLKPGGRLIIIDKNKFSIHPGYLIPTFVWKKVLEINNKWMYPKDFPFKEKYFSPTKINKFLLKMTSESSFQYLHYKHEEKKRPFLKNILFKIRKLISKLIFSIFPFLNMYVLWEAIK